ncbi:DEAD/DEAH box helicase [Lysinibacillus sp. 54212]|uniref:DEAD/DEAH box helicase n=1 Tax=Lysinibacillus sp. 54212 TaxID=3119829 RepID=UPI002FC83E52
MGAITTEKVRCHIVLTNTAREAIKEHVPDEQAFFNLQRAFIVYVEKLAIEQTQLSITLYFDPDKNKALTKKFPNRVVIMDCLFDLKSGLVAKSFRTRGKGTPVITNRREKMLIHFVPTRINGHTYPEPFITTLANLPVAQERFDYVNKRISSWEGYLKVLDKNAAIEDIDASFSSARFNAANTHVVMQLGGLDAKQWKALKGLSARVRGFKHDLGEVVKVNRGDRTAEIELHPEMARLAHKHELTFQNEQIEFTNAATKSQLKRLLKGFERLKEGLAANANLENILFEDKPVIAARRKDVEIEFHNQLNEFQRDAVKGAMSAEDLYVIQGPPGTGKTTVISEICYQNAKAGLKTLVASQSNLAVDNALSRLLSNKDIRILRYGRTESIEEEGKKFIEENVSAYWKKQTYEAITDENDHHTLKEAQLQAEITLGQQTIQNLEEKKQTLLEQIEQKKQAEKQLIPLNEEITLLKKKLVTFKKERDEIERTIDKLQPTKADYQAKIDKLEQTLAEFDQEEVLQKNIEDKKQLLEQVTKELEIAKLIQEQQQIRTELNEKEQKMDALSGGAAQIEAKATEIAALKKVYEVEAYMEQHQIRRSYVLDRILMSLDKCQMQLEEYQGIKEIAARIEKAIVYSETALGITVQQLPLPTNHSYSIREVDDFLSKLSHAFVQKKINRSNGTRSIQGLYLRKGFIEQLQIQYKKLINDTVILFGKMKEELIESFKQQQGNTNEVIQSLQETVQKLKGRMTATSLHLESLPSIEARPIAELQQILQTTESDLKQETNAIANISEIINQLSEQQQQLKVVEQEMSNGEKLLTEKTLELKTINSTGLQLEKEKQELENLIKQNPEAELVKTEQQVIEETDKIANLSTKITMLPITQSLQKQWQGLLENANDHDLDEIRKLYVKHANVIGTTCVASANKEFMDNYPTFDVVIIDEVSKATPPELLLPMLKGAKIILVGDHHQLPPLVGDETFNETLEQVIKDSDTFEEKRELEKLLEESLFERLYKNLPPSNKKMLAIQYRMHENIMKTIAPFYKNENEELQCGIQDSDAMRDHQLEATQFTRNNHLLWVDVPNKQGYFEERMKEGSSLFNEAELNIIKETLLEINEATALAKEQGRLPSDSLKSVGVISFYAEQVKRINRLIDQEVSLPHLHIRTGSVDKFQGMEMDVILVSMVRNNGNPHGDIGFAKDYRRLNVALSRAKELLMLVGSTEMFTKRPKQQKTRDMYSHVLATVKDQNGYRLVTT